MGSIILGLPEAAASKGRHLVDGPAPPLAWPVVHSAASVDEQEACFIVRDHSFQRRTRLWVGKQ